jgi:hypothetical protein
MKKLALVLILFAACDAEDFAPKACYTCTTTTTQYYGDKFEQFKTEAEKCGLTSSEAREVEVAASSRTSSTRIVTICEKN